MTMIPAIWLLESKSLFVGSSHWRPTAPKTSTWQYFMAPRISLPEKKFVYNINGNSNSSQMDKLSFPNLYKLHNLNDLMDFYLVSSRKICPRSFPSWTWKETERNRFLHVLHRNDNYIVFTLKTHWNCTTSTCVTC
jgi:hypothetical protein